MYRQLALLALALAPAFAGSIGSGTNECSGSPIVALGQSWSVCGGAYLDGDSITADSTLNSVNIQPLSTFAGAGYLTSYKGINGTDGSAILTTFTTEGAGTLTFNLRGYYNTLFYTLAILDGEIVADAWNDTPQDANTFENATFMKSFGAGQHTFVLAVTNGFVPAGVNAFVDPTTTLTAFNIDAASGVPEPGTFLIAAPLAAFALLRRRSPR